MVEGAAGNGRGGWRTGPARAATVLLLVLVALVGCVGAAPTPTAPSASITVTDIVGRTVSVKRPVGRMILGEGRQLYLVAALEPDDPFRRIVGWPEDLKTADLDAYEKYKEKFPQLTDIAVFGSPASGGFSVEKAIALKPDVVVLNFDSYTPARESGLIDQLAKAGIPSVVIDFRQYPLENTVPSTLLLGKLLGQEERAQRVVDFYLRQLNLVYARIEGIKRPKPSVFTYRAAGLTECCGTFGRANLGLLVERAGGNNVGSGLVPGWSGTVNPEQVLVANPEVIIATGSNWQHASGGKGWVRMGYAATPAESQEQLRALLASQPGWAGLNATKSGRVHVIWHQFYNSPYHFFALQQFAKWLYPEEFADLDPERSLREFHEQFLPIAYSGTFALTLQR